MEEINKRVKKFWGDFSLISQEIIKNPEDEDNIEKLDQLVNELGKYDWEYGPSNKAEYYFCLSPNLDENLLSEVESIVANSPKIENWEIIACKPRKIEPLMKWNMFNENDIEITINTNEWRCVLYKFPDNTYDLDVKLNNVDGNEDTQYLAVDIHLTNIIGEKDYMKFIKNISLVSEFSSESKDRSILLNEIYNYLPIQNHDK